jgi:WD40 repeat protein
MLLVAAVATSVVAVRSSRVAVSRQLAATANGLVNSAPTDELRNIAALLSVEAFHVAPTAEAYSNVVSLSADPHYATPLTASEAESIAFSPDGRTLAAGTREGATIWDVARRTPLATLPNPEGLHTTVAFSPPEGRMLAVAVHSIQTQTGDAILLWDVANRRVVATLPARHTVLDLTFSPDGRLLASVEVFNNLVRVWTVKSGARLAQLPGAGGELEAVAFGGDGPLLAVAAGKIITLWDLRPPGPARLAVLTGQTGDLSDVKFSPDGRTLASASLDKTVALWDVSRPDRPSQLATFRHLDSVEGVAFSPDGRTLASITHDRVFLWDIARRAPRATLTQGFAAEQFLSYFGSFVGIQEVLAFGGEAIATFKFGEAVLWDLDADRVAARICKRIGRSLTRKEWTQYVPGRRYHKTCG